jgi:hypothetical protein
MSSLAPVKSCADPNPDAFHVCYCHAPMRYLRDQRDIYFRQIPAVLRLLAHLYASHPRHSDSLSATRVDPFVANSGVVASQVWKYYRRESQILDPPRRRSPVPGPAFLFLRHVIVTISLRRRAW